MTQYTDTALKKFPFAQIRRPEEYEEDIPPRKKHMFVFDYIEDNEGFPWEDSKEIDRLLFQELGSTLDGIH